jgi:hypothetical protein
MENDFILVKDRLPEKNRGIVGIDGNGNEYYCFRCACNDIECKEWRCSLMGFMLLVDIIKWRYE